MSVKSAKGAAASGQGGCTGPASAWGQVSTSGFSGDYTCRAFDIGSVWTTSVLTGGATNGPLWVFGQAGHQVWAVCNGVTSTLLTW